MNEIKPELLVVGQVRSSLADRRNCPKMEHEGGVEAVIAIDPAYAPAMEGLKVGQELVLLTWLHQAGREYLQVHPRGDKANPKRGVFSTRSPDRPNPIGMHKVTIKALNGLELTVFPLEAIDGTPIIDIKPFLGSSTLKS